MVVDLIQATQDAVFAALDAQVDPSIAPVLQHAPQGTQPPFIKIGAIDTDSQGGKGEQLEKLTVEIHSVFRGEERGPLLTMMHAARLALDSLSASVRLSADGVDFGPMSFVSATAGDASVIDGLTYAGVSLFEVFAEPA